MKNVKMKKQAYQQKKTNGKTTNRISNKESNKILRRLKSWKSSRNSKLQKLLRPKAGILDQTRRRPRRLDEDVRKLSIEFIVIKV